MSQHNPIQIVNEEGEPLGVAESPFAAIEAGQIRLLSRVVIADGKGNFLLQKRAKNMQMYPACWDTAASGHVDEGETAEDAAYRELEEEIGIQTSLQLVTEYHTDLFIERYKLHFKSYSLVYRGTFTGDINTLKLQPDEVAGVEWFSKDQIEKLITEHPRRCTDGLLKIFGDGLL